MKNRLLRIAIVLAVISILPFVVLMAQREAPPEKIDVETHREQIIKNFVLQSEGSKRWILKSPKAIFEGEQQVDLDNPKVTVYANETITLTARRAVYDKQKQTVNLEQVTIIGKDFKGSSSYGVYHTKNETFTTNSTCMLTFDGNKEIGGKGCNLNFENERVIIKSMVKSTFREVANETR